MAEVKGIALMMAIRTVHRKVQYYDRLARSETLHDPQAIRSLALSYEAAARKLREAYIQERSASNNLPAYETLISSQP